MVNFTFWEHGEMKGKLISVITVAAFLVGCSRQEGPTVRGPVDQAADSGKPERAPIAVLEPDLDLYEMVFRRWGLPEDTKEVAFLSFGYGADAAAFHDPPHGFTERFDDLPYKLHPVSAARFPRDGEMVSEYRYRSVEEKSTGRSGYIYFVEVTKKTEREILLDVGFYGNYGIFGVSEIRATKEKGKWKLAPTGKAGIS